MLFKLYQKVKCFCAVLYPIVAVAAGRLHINLSCFAVLYPIVAFAIADLKSHFENAIAHLANLKSHFADLKSDFAVSHLHLSWKIPMIGTIGATMKAGVSGREDDWCVFNMIAL